MILNRRELVGVGGGLVAALFLPTRMAVAGETIDIRMTGKPDGSAVWFDPIGIHVRPGQTIRWTNGDPGNSHTATAYHPANFDHARRIPPAAKPWDSDYLLPNESFSVVLTVPGVYDYFCAPHEHAGMVGRIIVGDPGSSAWLETAEAKRDIPEVALNNFPSVEEIMANGTVRRA